MEPYSAIDTVVGWVATLYMWIPILAVLIVLLGMGLFNGVDFKRRVFLYPLLKIKMGKTKQFLVRSAE
jgi:hypothetical protein